MKAIAIFLLTVSSLCLCGQTKVSGVISSNTTWTKLNSPYLITSNVLVQENINLTIESGVTVKAEENSGIVLRGTLSAIGKTNDTIRFIANNNLEWSGIVADKNFSPKIGLAFVKAEKAKVFIDIINTSPAIITSTPFSDTLLSINNSHFENNDFVIISEDSQNHFSFINNSLFINNTSYAFLYTGYSSIKNSEFHNCEKALYNNDQTITTVENCIFTGHNRAIAINGVVKNSEFYNNNRAIITMNNNSPELRYNYIHDNKRGIETWTYNTSNPKEQIKFNKICNNEYNIYQFYSGTSYVSNNCWCTINESEIEAKIYDRFDNASLGKVEYSPFDSTCSFLNTSVYDRPSMAEISELVKVYPNPTNSFLIIDFQSLGFDSKIDKFIMYNSVGEAINSDYSSQSNRIILNGENLQSGCYFIRINVDGYWISKKFIKN